MHSKNRKRETERKKRSWKRRRQRARERHGDDDDDDDDDDDETKEEQGGQGGEHRRQFGLSLSRWCNHASRRQASGSFWTNLLFRHPSHQCMCTRGLFPEDGLLGCMGGLVTAQSTTTCHCLRHLFVCLLFCGCGRACVCKRTSLALALSTSLCVSVCLLYLSLPRPLHLLLLCLPSRTKDDKVPRWQVPCSCVLCDIVQDGSPQLLLGFRFAWHPPRSLVSLSLVVCLFPSFFLSFFVLCLPGE